MDAYDGSQSYDATLLILKFWVLICSNIEYFTIYMAQITITLKKYLNEYFTLYFIEYFYSSFLTILCFVEFKNADVYYLYLKVEDYD